MRFDYKNSLRFLLVVLEPKSLPRIVESALKHIVPIETDEDGPRFDILKETASNTFPPFSRRQFALKNYRKSLPETRQQRFGVKLEDGVRKHSLQAMESLKHVDDFNNVWIVSRNRGTEGKHVLDELRKSSFQFFPERRRGVGVRIL